MATDIPDDEIGGGLVLRTFTRGDKHLKRGERLTAEEILSMPITNRHALVDANYLKLSAKNGAAIDVPRERFIIMTGKNEYGVIEGRKINNEPLSKQDAERLAQ